MGENTGPTGVIILNKPKNFTSFDAIAVARGMTRQRKIGHTGTLDPMATGVLPLLLGRAAKAADLIEDTQKEYLAGFKLGEKRDTGDITGEIVESSQVRLSKEVLEAATKKFTGEIEQIPPMYSAVQVNGQRLYTLARQGIEIERKPRKVFIDKLTLESFDEKTQSGTLFVSCSKGTYIRTLIEDIAESAGALATMTSLERTKACGFSVEQAVSMEELQRLTDEGKLGEVIMPVGSLFESLPKVRLSEGQTRRFQNGGNLDLERLKLGGVKQEGTRLSVYNPADEFVGLGAISKEQLKPLKLFLLL